MNRIVELWNQLSATARGLLLFAFANVIVVNAALPHLPLQPQQITTWDYTEAFFKRTAHGDSWKAMRTALYFTDAPRSKPLYTAVYFDNNVRFQYPPSSLLVLELLRLGPWAGPISDPTLNGVSWAAIWLLGLAVAGIFFTMRARLRAPGDCESRGDLVVFAFLAFVFTVTFYPVVRGYYLGQIQVWIDLLIALLIWAWLADRTRLAGILLSLICVIKPTLAILIVWGVVRRHWHFVIGWAVPMSAFAVLTLAVYGWENHVDYLKVLSYISRHGEIFHPNQSMNGLLHRLLGNGDSLVWARDLLMNYHPWVHAGTIVSSLVLIALALVPDRGRLRTDDPSDLAVAILCSTLAAPTVWTHHYGVTLPIFALVLPRVLELDLARRTRWLALLGICFSLISNNFRVLNRLSETPLNFLQSYVYLAGLLLLVLVWKLRRRGMESDIKIATG